MVVAATAAGCGSSSEGAADRASFEKISDPGRILSIEDVEAVGWKRGREYDVTGLTGAHAAYLGFWSPPGSGVSSYEIRVYPTHQAAVELGTRFAEEGSGENAALDAEDAKWAEGVRDRRVVVGGGSRGSQKPEPSAVLFPPGPAIRWQPGSVPLPSRPYQGQPPPRSKRVPWSPDTGNIAHRDQD